jgi:hypothetical protein
MPDLGWKEAITEILKESDEPLHYTEIAERIAHEQLRAVGATPAASVNATISLSLKDDGEKSPFVRVVRGYYDLRQKEAQSISVAPSELPETPDYPSIKKSKMEELMDELKTKLLHVREAVPLP